MLRSETKLYISNPDDTSRFAKALGEQLHTGDVVLLHGQIGAGKTFFARALIQSLLAEYEDVPSPTYTLVQTYNGQSGEIWHADLYRLSGLDEVLELGLNEAFSDAICLVEWPERLGNLAPQSALSLEFTATSNDDTREVTVRWSDTAWDSRVKQAIDALKTK